MKIEAIHLVNFKAFRDVELRDLPKFGVFVGANGTGKSTLFNVFGFLKDALTEDVHVALTRLGGSRGFQEVRSRNTEGPIEIELKFRENPSSPLVTYTLAIDEEFGSPVVVHEILKYRRGSTGKPWHFIDFSKGTGQAVVNEPEEVKVEADLRRETQTLKSADTLALKGLAQFRKFPAAVSLGELISNWHLSDFHVQRARPEQEAGYAEHLSREGENLSLVTEYLYKRHRETFELIIDKLKKRVPGI